MTDDVFVFPKNARAIDSILLPSVILMLALTISCFDGARAQDASAWSDCVSIGATRPQTIGQVSVTADDYPLVSLGLREEGRAVIDLDVAEDGAIQGARIDATTGSFRLDERSLELVHERWRFQPALIGEEAVACTTKVAVRWELNNVEALIDGENQPSVEISEELLRLLEVLGAE